MKKHVFLSLIAAVMFLVGSNVLAGDKEPSGTVVIDETLVILIQ